MTDAARIERILAQLPDPADRAAVLRLAPAWVRRQRRLAERDEALRELATFYPLASGREIAGHIRADLSRILSLSRGWRECDQTHMSALRCVLSLSDGRVPGDRTIRAALAGIGGQHSPPDIAQEPRDTEPKVIRAER
jgi:hypothetical protein